MHGRDGAWLCWCMGAWTHGRVGAWPCRGMAGLVHGRVGAWPCWGMAVSGHGRVGAWPCRGMSVSRQGRVSVWPCQCMSVSRQGRVGARVEVRVSTSGPVFVLWCGHLSLTLATLSPGRVPPRTTGTGLKDTHCPEVIIMAAEQQQHYSTLYYTHPAL